MDIKSILIKSVWAVSFLLASLASLILVFCIIAFLFNIENKGLLQFILFDAVFSAILWAVFFFLSSYDKNKTKEERKKDFATLMHKMPYILASSIITAVYVLIFFFMFTFITVSKYGNGGLGGDASYTVWLIVFLLLGFTIFGIVMFKVFKTEKQDMSLTLYNQFSVLKWSSLIALPFGLWAAYYFYHTGGGSAWVAMFVWFLIFFGFYKLFNKLANKVQDSITNANLNRIIHEKKKNMLNKQTENQISEQSKPTVQQETKSNVRLSQTI